jgi:hypothetical protein
MPVDHGIGPLRFRRTDCMGARVDQSRDAETRLKRQEGDRESDVARATVCYCPKSNSTQRKSTTSAIFRLSVRWRLSCIDENRKQLPTFDQKERINAWSKIIQITP